MIARASWCITLPVLLLVCLTQTIICFDSARADFGADARLNDMVCTQNVMSHTPTRHERMSVGAAAKVKGSSRRGITQGAPCPLLAHAESFNTIRNSK